MKPSACASKIIPADIQHFIPDSDIAYDVECSSDTRVPIFRLQDLLDPPKQIVWRLDGVWLDNADLRFSRLTKLLSDETMSAFSTSMYSVHFKGCELRDPNSAMLRQADTYTMRRRANTHGLFSRGFPTFWH